MPSSPAESGPLVSLEGQRQKDQCQLLVGSQGVPFSCPSSSAGGGGPGERSLHTVVESSQDCAQMDEHWPLRPCPCLKSKRLLRSLEIRGSSPVQWSIKKMVENDHRAFITSDVQMTAGQSIKMLQRVWTCNQSPVGWPAMCGRS